MGAYEDNQAEYKVDATLLEETPTQWRLDCEGDIEWFPKSICKFDADKEELTAPLWLLKKKFPETNW